jgi:hypothetical protein
MNHPSLNSIFFCIFFAHEQLTVAICRNSCPLINNFGPWSHDPLNAVRMAVTQNSFAFLFFVCLFLCLFVVSNCVLCVHVAEGVFPESPGTYADGCRETAALALLALGNATPAHFDHTESFCENVADLACNLKTNDPDLLWKAFISTLNRHRKRFGNSGSGLRMMLKRLQRINSSSEWETFMHASNCSR